MRNSAEKMHTLPSIMKHYRLLGFCFYSDNAKSKLIYKVYCFGLFTLQLFMGFSMLAMFLATEEFNSKMVVQRLPFILSQILRIIHFGVTSLCVLQNNRFILDFYTNILQIQNKINPAVKISYPNTFQSRLSMFFLIAVTSLCIVFITDIEIVKKLLFSSLTLFNYHEYIKEEWIILSMLTIRDTLTLVNQEFQKNPVTEENVKNFREIHSRLVGLNLQVKDHFRLMITTWVASAGLIISSHLFTFLEMTTSVNSSPKLMLVSAASSALQCTIKLAAVCNCCEAVIEEVSYCE